MTVNEAIKRADALRPNTFELEAKARAVINLDMELAETMRPPRPPRPPFPPEPPANPAPTFPPVREYNWPQEDPELLMPAPHDGIYVLYLCCEIDLYNQETTLYANDAAVYETALAEAKAWRRRHVRAEDKGAVKVL